MLGRRPSQAAALTPPGLQKGSGYSARGDEGGKMVYVQQVVKKTSIFKQTEKQMQPDNQAEVE